MGMQGKQLFGGGLVGDRRGAVAAIFAMTLVPLLACSAMVADIGLAYARRAALQQVADSAALAGAMAYMATKSTGSVQATVQDVVMANGLASSTIQSPGSEYMASSPQNSANAAVKVTLSAPTPITIGAFISKTSSWQLQVSALVEIVGTKHPACLLSLSTLIVNGSIDVNGCSVATDSLMIINGGATVTANTVSATYGIIDNGTINGTTSTGNTVADPYTAYQSQAAAANTNCTQLGSLSPAPGCYSNANVNSGQTLTLKAGVYYFQSLNINSGAALIATSGTTVIVGQNFSPNAVVDITAPTTGPWAGMGLYLVQGGNMNSGSTYAINGAIYAPSATVILNGASWNQNACTYIVAQQVIPNGGSVFTLPQANCAGFNYPAPSLAAAGAGSGSSSVVLTQ